MPNNEKTTLVTSVANSPFEVTRRLARAYAADLRKISREVDRIVGGHLPPDGLLKLDSMPKMVKALSIYSKLLEPWAQRKATEVVEHLTNMNKRAWKQHARNLSKGVKAELDRAPIRDVMDRYIAEQAAFIGNIPLDAAQRVEKLHEDVLTKGRRAEDVAKELMASGKVSATRATLIARTEVARTSNGLTRARAEYIGAETYIWRTARDADVRSSHRAMEGKTVSYAVPPSLGDGTSAHAGEIYNCRCYQEPVIPDRFF